MRGGGGIGLVPLKEPANRCLSNKTQTQKRQLCCEKQLVVSEPLLLSLDMSSHRHMQLQSLEAGGDWVQRRVIARTSANISDLFISHCDAPTNELNGVLFTPCTTELLLLLSLVTPPRRGPWQSFSSQSGATAYQRHSDVCLPRQVNQYPRRTPRA